MKGKPKRLIKSAELSSLDGVKELSFGKSSAETRQRTGDYSKKPKEHAPRQHADVQARRDRFGFGNL
jgi:hypothetical protein